MNERREGHIYRGRLLSLLILVLLLGLSAGTAFAGKLADTTAGLPKASPAGSGTGLSGSARTGVSSAPNGKSSAPDSLLGNAYMTIDGSLTILGSLPDNPNSGGTITTGDRFVLDLNVHGNPATNLTCAVAIVTYDSNLAILAEIGNTPVPAGGHGTPTPGPPPPPTAGSIIGTSCVAAQTVKRDNATFDSELQNEWCNGPAPCVFRDVNTPAGYGAVSEGALTNCTAGCGPDFRVAAMGFCAMAPGTFTIHWQFSPPDPIGRDTEVVDSSNTIVSNPALFSDYTITIVGSPLPTLTNTSTPTNTNTSTPTNTATNTPPATFTPVCSVSQAAVITVPPGLAIPDNNANGVTSTLTILPSTIGGTISDVDVTNIWITHTRIADLRLRLTSPNGTVVNLISAAVCSAPARNNMKFITFDDFAAAAIGTSCASPYNGTFRPQSPLSAMNGGPAAGTWSLNVRDATTGSTGTFDGWRVRILSQDSCSAPTDTPTGTPTATPTPPGIIVGHVTWQGITQPDPRNNGVTLTLSLCVAGVPHNYSGTTDAGGFFTATTNLPDGVYNWWVKGQINLSGAGTLSLTTGTANAEMGLMRSGDCNNDNVAGAVDFSILKDTFGKSVGQPGYDARGDFNRDGAVGSVDVSFHKSNYGQSGAAATCP